MARGQSPRLPAGTSINTVAFTSDNAGAATFLPPSDPRTVVPGMPFTAYVIIRATF